MKRKFTIILALLLIFSFATGCSGNNSDRDTADKGELTFKEAMSRKGTHVWYDLESLAGRNSVVLRAIVITDDKAIVYDPKDVMAWNKEPLGRLEDYTALSQEEAAELIDQKYKEAYKNHYDSLINNNLGSAESKLKSQRTEELIENIKETHEELTSSDFSEKEPQEYDFHMILDSTGNKAESEALRTTVTYEKNFVNKPDGSMQGYPVFSITEETEEEQFFAVDDVVAPFEVYDEFYGGFSAGASSGTPVYLITKCREDTVFTFDPVGKEGITIVK